MTERCDYPYCETPCERLCDHSAFGLQDGACSFPNLEGAAPPLTIHFKGHDGLMDGSVSGIGTYTIPPGMTEAETHQRSDSRCRDCLRAEQPPLEELVPRPAEYEGDQGG